MTNDDKKLGIYVHIPFCLQKCGYCDFYSVPLAEKAWLERYVHCLIREIKKAAADFSRLPVETIFFGGGTPNLLSPEQLRVILEALVNSFNIEDDAEISIEANPYRHNPGALKLIREAGINRISLGAQSFCDQELKILGRLHTANDVLETIESVSEAGFDNFSLDLIYGLPGQSLQRWQDNLKMAVSRQPTHISAYLLQLSDQTPMARQVGRKEIQLLDDDTESLMYYSGIEYLSAQGFKHYELSNFAQPGYECRHNLRYWNARQYLGLGPGAVSYYDCKRVMNEPRVIDYMNNWEKGKIHPVRILETMSEKELIVDAIILGLRLTGGINRRDFQNRFGVDIIDTYHDVISKGIKNQLLNFTDDTLALSVKGYFLANEVLCQFIT
ncbi:MAG: radical SAM family heme chaperone HemW [Syntrophomonas sp.]